MLQGLGPEAVSQLVASLETLDFESGEYIVEMGTAADALYLILAGEVACHQGGDSELRLAEGAFFGESCLSQASAPLRQANVVAVTHVRVARLPAAHVDAMLGPLQRALERGFVEKLLSSIALFDPLSAGERALLLEALRTRVVPAGEVVIRQGALNDTFYIVRSGAVNVTLDAEPAAAAAPTHVQTLRGGEPTGYFGERSLLTSAPAVATVTASEESELLCLPKERFDQLLMHGSERALIVSQVEARDGELLTKARGPRVPWDELERRAILGIGSFGCVKLVVHLPTGRAYALKGLHKGHLIHTNQIKNVVSEKALLRACDHPFIMRCHDSYNSPHHVHLLLGLALGGELFSYMQRVRRLSETGLDESARGEEQQA